MRKIKDSNTLKEKFLEILSDYQGILHKVSLVYFKSKTDREDNFQEIVYQLWKSYPKLQKEKSIGSWIYAVSINTSLSRLKKNHESGTMSQYQNWLINQILKMKFTTRKHFNYC